MIPVPAPSSIGRIAIGVGRFARFTVWGMALGLAVDFILYSIDAQAPNPAKWMRRVGPCAPQCPQYCDFPYHALNVGYTACIALQSWAGIPGLYPTRVQLANLSLVDWSNGWYRVSNDRYKVYESYRRITPIVPGPDLIPTKPRPFGVPTPWQVPWPVFIPYPPPLMLPGPLPPPVRGPTPSEVPLIPVYPLSPQPVRQGGYGVPGPRPDTESDPWTWTGNQPGQRPAVRPLPRPNPRERPRPREKERKIKARPGVLFAIKTALQGATEVNDFIGVLYNSLPKWLRDRYRPQLGDRVDPFEMMDILYRHWDKVDLNRGFCEYLNNELEDRVFGGFGRLQGSAGRHLNSSGAGGQTLTGQSRRDQQEATEVDDPVAILADVVQSDCR